MGFEEGFKWFYKGIRKFPSVLEEFHAILRDLIGYEITSYACK